MVGGMSIALGSSLPGNQGSRRFQESARKGLYQKEGEKKRERERERVRRGGGCNDGERANCRVLVNIVDCTPRQNVDNTFMHAVSSLCNKFPHKKWLLMCNY